jgi:hypothetical protein
VGPLMWRIAPTASTRIERAVGAVLHASRALGGDVCSWPTSACARNTGKATSLTLTPKVSSPFRNFELVVAPSA